MPVSDQLVRENIQAHLQADEQLRHFAYGVKQPPIWLIALGFLFGIIPGVIIVATGTKEFYVALTDRRLLLLRVKNMKRILPEGHREYALGSVPPVRSKAGGLFGHLWIDDPLQPFAAKFHRMGMKDNRERVVAIAQALAR